LKTFGIDIGAKGWVKLGAKCFLKRAEGFNLGTQGFSNRTICIPPFRAHGLHSRTLCWNFRALGCYLWLNGWLWFCLWWIYTVISTTLGLPQSQNHIIICRIALTIAWYGLKPWIKITAWPNGYVNYSIAIVVY
jgi:hypothetical protein